MRRTLTARTFFVPADPIQRRTMMPALYQPDYYKVSSMIGRDGILMGSLTAATSERPCHGPLAIHGRRSAPATALSRAKFHRGA
jgi:hypothetical protein